MLTEAEVERIGFASVGRDVRISPDARFYGAARIRIGNHVRIDDFSVLSAGDGGINIGDFVHIAVYCSIIGRANVTLENFCNLSSRVSIYASNDDYSGATLTNPTVPEEYKRVTHEPVHLSKHVIVGSGSIILPGVTLAEGVAVGALSVIRRDCEAFGVYVGNPAKKIKDRRRDLLKLEKKLMDELLGEGTLAESHRSSRVTGS
jgi:dTDP-4-amino-4,6-dideoxy-D-glucose acyltransferase